MHYASPQGRQMAGAYAIQFNALQSHAMPRRRRIITGRIFFPMFQWHHHIVKMLLIDYYEIDKKCRDIVNGINGSHATGSRNV